MHHPTITSKPTHCLAQARGSSRSGEGVFSLRRNPSRLGEIAKGKERTLRGLAQVSPFSPRRDHSSLKNKNLSSKREIEQQVLGEPLLILPGRENQCSPLFLRVTATHMHPHSPTGIFNRLNSHTDRSIITYPSNKQILPKTMVRSSFPYLEKLTETSICSREHHNYTSRPKNGTQWNRETKQGYYKALTGTIEPQPGRISH